MNSSAHNFTPGFANTRWSLVVDRTGVHARDQGTALIELCQGYWYPVYSFLRGNGHSPELARELARSFQQFMKSGSITGLKPAAGERFRDFLLVQLKEFLAREWFELEAGVEAAEGPSGEDLESRNLAENADSRTPEEAYQRSFGNEVIARAFKRLRTEAESNGHLDMYLAMLPFVSREPDQHDYDELATQLRSRPLTLVVALKRLRQRFRELVGEELSDTVDTLDGLIEEQKTLHGILRRPN